MFDLKYIENLEFYQDLSDEKKLELVFHNKRMAEIIKEKEVPQYGDTKLHRKIFYNLQDRCNFGIKRGEVKDLAIKDQRDEARKNGKVFKLQDLKLDGIYSHGTFRNYLTIGNRFADYCERKELDVKSITKAEPYAVEFLKDMESRGLSPYSLQQASAFFSKLYGHRLDYTPPQRHYRDIEKGREVAMRESKFDPQRNKDLVTVAKATGGRRSDLDKLETQDFDRNHQGIIVGVYFKGSKGGRDRWSPIIPKYQKEVTEYVNKLERENKGKAFKSVNKNANIHAYRREYARELYLELMKNQKYKDDLMRKYSDMKCVYHGKCDIDGNYRSRDGVLVANRGNLFVVSQALGHNRIDVVANHYLR